MLGLQDRFQLNEDDYFIIPMDWCPTKFYTITFEGWKDYSLDSTDPYWLDIIDFSSETVKNFLSLYKKDHAFSQPQFFLKTDGTFTIKIATLELERYHFLMDKKKESNE